MKILITESGQYLCESKEEPVPGRRYTLEDAATGTAAQSNAFHALMAEYFRSGCHSYQATSLEAFKKEIKRSLGPESKYEAFVYVDPADPSLSMKDAESWDDIPEHIRNHPDKRLLVRGRLKSWADYSKKERRETMDRLISEMHQAGVQTPKFMGILEGMEQ
jgi:hypothetical protein